jgi:hypothetical protein
LDEPVPAPNDPGGAHGKGYSAQPGSGRPVKDDDPVPLASDADTGGHVRKPDQSHALPSAGPGQDSGSSRVMGADR